MNCCRMEGESVELICRVEGESLELRSEVKERVVHIFRECMTRLAKFEELTELGSRLLNGYQQGFDFLRRPPIKKSELVEKIIKENETKGLKSYFGEKSKCIKTCDAVANINKLNTCHSGLKDHLIRANTLVRELEMLFEETTTVIQCTNDALIQFCKDPTNVLDEAATSTFLEVSVSSPSHVHKSEALEYALMTGVICTMAKKDYTMQEKIVTTLNFKLSSEELESYCLMWSLRPYIHEDIMSMAWKLIS